MLRGVCLEVEERAILPAGLFPQRRCASDLATSVGTSATGITYDFTEGPCGTCANTGSPTFG